MRGRLKRSAEQERGVIPGVSHVSPPCPNVAELSADLQSLAVRVSRNSLQQRHSRDWLKMVLTKQGGSMVMACLTRLVWYILVLF